MGRATDFEHGEIGSLRSLYFIQGGIVAEALRGSHGWTLHSRLVSDHRSGFADAGVIFVPVAQPDPVCTNL